MKVYKRGGLLPLLAVSACWSAGCSSHAPAAKPTVTASAAKGQETSAERFRRDAKRRQQEDDERRQREDFMHRQDALRR